MKMKYINAFRNLRVPVTIMTLLLISSMLFTGGCIDLLEPKYQTGELSFSIVPMHDRTQASEGSMFMTYLVLKNVGNETVNVWDLEEQVSYDVHVYDSNNNEVPYECGVISVPLLTDEFLVELPPGKSIADARSSRCWNLTEGKYTFNAVYHTSTGEEITEPYWLGEIQSNNLTITVVKPPVLNPDPLRFSIWNYSKNPHKVKVEVFDENNSLIFTETYLINSSEGKYSPTIIYSPIVTETLGTYKYVVTLDHKFTAVQSAEVRYEMTTSSSDYVSIDIRDNKENPISFGISIA
ncbi:hypothetical protein ACT9XH_10420 [Methanococcoides methylutens]|uniref:hypothetical protein n=1 Tax=Methanococcoides methylutens TaxID=2226 RepID=UPI004044066D